MAGVRNELSWMTYRRQYGCMACAVCQHYGVLPNEVRIGLGPGYFAFHIKSVIHMGILYITADRSVKHTIDFRFISTFQAASNFHIFQHTKKSILSLSLFDATNKTINSANYECFYLL